MNVINLSGGRSSAYMLWRLLQEHGGVLPKGWIVLFANTGKEREETLVFVHEIEQRWGVPIVWLEYRYYPERKGRVRGHEKNDYAVVDFESASRNGEPFDQLVVGHRYLPHKRARTCTFELKVETFSRYLKRGLGIKEWDDYLGIRYDESRRWVRLSQEPDTSRVFPLVRMKVTQAEVQDFWRKQNFDLGIPSVKGNCDLCFLKGRSNLVETLRAEPHLADWWVEKEDMAWDWKNRTHEHKLDATQFSPRISYRDLLSIAQQPQLIPVADIDDKPMNCYCGD